jgi:TonB family protein
LGNHGVFLRAGVIACGMHLVILGMLAASLAPRESGLGLDPPRASEMRLLAASAMDEPTWVDLASPNGELPAIPSSPAQPSEDLATMDHGALLGRSQAPRISIAPERDRPAPDRGDGPGQRQAPAFRRDTSSLHARLTDGASRYRPEHERTHRAASSPDATRQEPRVGLGDLSRTRRRLRPQAGEAAPGGASDGEQDQRPATGANQEFDPPIAGDDPVRGHGPLDAQAGRRQFDVPHLGPARDTRWVRAASDEKHPGLMDLSAASTPGPGVQPGKGPGIQPGATDRASPGQAASPAGVDAVVRGERDGHGAAEQIRARYELEVRRQVSRVLRFPHRLAVQLEQGESIVAFTVGPNGRVQGEVRLVKSAGFEEFDHEARAAVLRAAPFPPAGRLTSFCMRVPFENPVVR